MPRERNPYLDYLTRPRTAAEIVEDEAVGQSIARSVLDVSEVKLVVDPNVAGVPVNTVIEPGANLPGVK